MLPPPFLSVMQFQKKAWFHAWAALLKTGVGDPLFHDTRIIYSNKEDRHLRQDLRVRNRTRLFQFHRLQLRSGYLLVQIVDVGAVVLPPMKLKSSLGLVQPPVPVCRFAKGDSPLTCMASEHPTVHTKSANDLTARGRCHGIGRRLQFKGRSWSNRSLRHADSRSVVSVKQDPVTLAGLVLIRRASSRLLAEIRLPRKALVDTGLAAFVIVVAPALRTVISDEDLDEAIRRI